MSRDGGRMLITGGAGFIGVNAAHHFAEQGWLVTIYDTLLRPGSARNLSWIQRVHGGAVRMVRADVRDDLTLAEAVRGQDVILHLAAQVAVTSSLVAPVDDFEVNARGTLNVLESVRRHAPRAILLFASTNKVYGGLESSTFRRTSAGWLPEDQPDGISETQPLDFHSPYGCSKGAADQYVRDYARCFGLKTVVLRQSCIYGAHQYGNEDQGWVAHFVHSMFQRAPITIFGDGAQVRDLLDVRDLCRLYSHCIERIDDCASQVLNVGGGAGNARSIIDVLHTIESLLETRAVYRFEGWRAGDQRYYVSDIRLAEQLLEWRPEIPFDAGLHDLVRWVDAEGAASPVTPATLRG
jgi:CDP-paratose 2-epimerase